MLLFKKCDVLLNITDSISIYNIGQNAARTEIPDHFLDSQALLNPLNNDVEGKHLASLLSEGKTVKVETANGRWISTIYLPERKHLTQENALFRLNCRAQSGNTIYHNGKQLSISEGYDVVFQFIKGVWCIIRKIKILFSKL